MALRKDGIATLQEQFLEFARKRILIFEDDVPDTSLAQQMSSAVRHFELVPFNIHLAKIHFQVPAKDFIQAIKLDFQSLGSDLRVTSSDFPKAAIAGPVRVNFHLSSSFVIAQPQVVKTD